MRIRLYRGATEKARKRTLRPTHETLSTKLYYSAACVGTTLPSGAVATQGDGKTRCRGNNNVSTHSPMVHNSCVPLQMFVGAVHEQDWPSIPEMSRTEIIAVCPQMRVVHLSEPKAIGTVAILRPKRAFRPRSGQKIARVSAQYSVSQAHLFAYFFWQDRKSRSAKQQLRCHRKEGSSGECRKRGPMCTRKGWAASVALLRR